MRLPASLLSLALILAVAASQFSYDSATQGFKAQLKQASLNLSEPLLPTVPALQALSFGNQPLVADLLWLDTIQYFGQGNPYGTYPSLGPILDRITSIDPNYEYPYEFGMVVLPFMKQADIAVTLGERAQQHITSNGLLSYYLATVYHLNLKDYEKAGHYYELASTQPGAPTAAKHLAGVAYAHADSSLDKRLVAVSFWETVYKNAKNEDERTQAKNWYLHTQLVYQIELAAQTYKTQNGHFPASIAELTQKGFLPGTPVSPIGRLLLFHPDTGKVSFDQLDPNVSVNQ